MSTRGSTDNNAQPRTSAFFPMWTWKEGNVSGGLFRTASERARVCNGRQPFDNRVGLQRSSPLGSRCNVGRRPMAVVDLALIICGFIMKYIIYGDDDRNRDDDEEDEDPRSEKGLERVVVCITYSIVHSRS